MIDRWARKDAEHELAVEQGSRPRISVITSGGWIKSAGLGIAILIVNEILFASGLPNLPVDAMLVLGILPLVVYVWRYVICRRAIRASNFEKTFD